MLNFFRKPKLQEDVALLVQGPFNLECLKSINSSKFQFKQIVYSTWESQSIDYEKLKGFEIVTQELPDVNNIDNTANIYYQICSTLAGLKLVKTKYVMKHRADESYNKLHLVIEKFAPEKLLCANIYFRPIKYKAFHISDHFFLGETSRLLDTFTMLQKYYLKNDDYLSILNNQCSAEQIITLFYLSTFGYKIEELILKQKQEDFVFEIMKKHFDVFDVKTS
ncbi:MAG: WavE lipopolysaccharide synthesis family protein [Pseudomonadota bacterium]